MIRDIVIPKPIRKVLKKLPQEIKNKFYWSLEMLLKNERYPSLRHKKIEGTNTYWEFSITMNYRAVYRREGDKGFIVAIGKHEDIF